MTSPLLSVSGLTVHFHTEAGVVRARHGVLACDALLEGLEPRIAGRADMGKASALVKQKLAGQ